MRSRPAATRQTGVSTKPSARKFCGACEVLAASFALRSLRRFNRSATQNRASSTRNTNPARPTQSPHITIKVVGGSRTDTCPINSFCSPIAVLAVILPLASITALTPLLVTRICGSRVSMLRNAETVRCRFAPTGYCVNQESFDMLRMAWAPSRAPSMPSPVLTSSRQIIGSTGISRPSARRKGNTRAPEPRFQLPAQGNMRRAVGPSSHCGKYSVNKNRSDLR